MTIEADRMWSPSASSFLENPSGAQYKRTETKKQVQSGEISQYAVAFVTRATCVISGRTVEKTNDSLGYCPFTLRVEQAKSYQTHCVERVHNLLKLKDFLQ